MDGIITTVLTILVFGFLIFIHEFGHYITARLFRVSITEFSIGMGPPLVTYDSPRSNIRYTLAMLPIGGFVAMVGEDEESDDPNSFDKKPAWQRFIITAAGATVNLVFGFIAMFIIVAIIRVGDTTVGQFYTEEDYAKYGENITYEVPPDSFLKLGDKILKVEGNEVFLADELSYEIMRHGNKPVDLVIERDGEVIELNDVSFPIMKEADQEVGVMGFYVYPMEKNIGNFFTISFRKTALVLRMCYESIYDLITGRYSLSAVSGPVGISGAIGDAAKAGVAAVLNIVVIISMNLGIMNLLPIPALDGGRLIVILFEMITRKRISPKVEGIINGVGLAVLLLLTLVIMVKDIFMLF